MNATVARLTVRSLLGRRRALLLLALPVVLLAVAGVVRWVSGPNPGLALHVLAGLALGTLVPLLGLITGTGAIGPEIDDGSIVYLLSKPLRRPVIVVTKLSVAVGVVLLFAALPTLLAGLLLAGQTRHLALGFGAAAAVAGVAYCALFLSLAVVTRHAVVIGLIYLLVWETLIGQFVPGAQVLSIQQWALAVAARVVTAPPGGTDGHPTSAVALTTGVIMIVALVVLVTWFAGRRLAVLRLTGEE